MCTDKLSLKTIASAILLFIQIPLIFMLGSCNIQSTEHLLYQKYPFQVFADVDVDSFRSSVRITMQSENSGTVSYISPQTLCGVVFHFGEDGIFISYDDTKLPLTAKSDANFLILIRLFSLKEEEFAGAKLIRAGEESGLNCAEFKTDAGDINVYTDSNGYPQKISAELYGHNVKMSVTGFEYLEAPESGN